MLRYRIAQGESGTYFVLPALAAVVPIEETYATRNDAREMVDWLNRLKPAHGTATVAGERESVRGSVAPTRTYGGD